ncbi:hypothetical protein [Anaerotruncus colihominis]|uniref:DUF4062 domain-containing protein n=1 Tax=Anaerotruncus colihominis TaxID=169435 RepID=A0A845SYL7_9FIRM|nr:hypothetical protein [Anaerotruncus colihominis]NDO39600.1 hypothetical protein [Anaerotruncus colihominis]
MDNLCFVIMPFGDLFDELYKRVYAPAIEAMGLEPLRADEIYNNRPIIDDINQSIYHAAIVLADVTGRNPNVNYELGIAHALKKEVVILTAEPDDVPSDYRHIRYIRYNRTAIDWNRKLSEDIQKTLRQVLLRLKDQSAAQEGLFETDDTNEWNSEEEETIARAMNLGMKFQLDPRSPSHALMSCMGCHVMLDSLNGPVTELEAAMACLLNEKVHALISERQKGHCLRMRSVFFGTYASHAFYVDYLYDRNVLPMYTQQELYRYLSDEFCGWCFEPHIRYIQENFDHDRFNVDQDEYYSLGSLPQEQNPVCFRENFYVADISGVYYSEKRGEHYYHIDGLLPSSLLGAEPIPKENHWLADWGQKRQRFRIGDTVKFKVEKVYKRKDYNHTNNARDITFSQLEVIYRARA